MVLICRTCAVFLVLIFSVGIKTCASQYNRHWSDKYDESNRCPKLYPKNFVSYVPFGNLTAGNYTEKLGLKGLRQCVMACCISDPCNVAFIFNSRCYHVECVSNELCVPLRRSGRGKWDAHVSMILVKPVLPNENWQDILDQSGSAIQSTNKQQLESSSNFLPEDDIYPSYTSHTRNNMLNDDDESNLLSQFLNNLPNIEDDDLPRTFDNDNDVIVDTSTFFDKSLEIPCEVGAQDECPFHSECVPLGLKTRNGFCKCMPGTEENAQGACVQTIRPYSKGPTDLDSLKKNSELSLGLKSDFQSETSSLGSVQNLTVSIFSKEVQLPENEVTLAAYTIPDEKATKSHYSYSWTLVDQPKESFTGNMNQNGATVTLTDLTEGQYRFKVTVNATNAYGEGFANVTVHPPKRTNKPPQVVITPQAQTVKLPNTGAVLDGSASKDDDAIISWHWELTSGPIGYQPPLKDGPTLVLNDLKQPGNYTFKLTVEDSDHVKNSTSANITVLNHTDYPPEANAGQDVIIYLPNNNLTLNGSLSTDDHEITSWEWTKAAEDENKAVDMQNTHSPYLQLSNLSEGVYTFVLKVTDSSGQSSTAEVRVFVKPPTNIPPVANAGPDLFISLPQTWVILNGSASQDDHRIVAYTWRCVSGPNNASVLRHNESVANATGLTKGVYEFSLSVLDDSGNTATDDVTVTVAQNKNSPPKADAGGDLVLSLPVPVLLLNGSRSSDDFRIVSWQWTRSPSGLAAGTVIMDSHTKPVLMLTNIEAGRYVFELTVTDDQGASSRDAVSVQVKPDPLETSLLEVTLNVPVAAFTRSQLDSLLQKLVLLLKEDITVNVTEVRGERDTGNVQLVFFLWDQNKAVEGLRALSLVNSARHAGLSDIVSHVRSVRCLSTCSGRGTCDQATRACRCPPAWMQSLLSQLQSDAQPDCAWSVVYFSLSGVLVLCGTCGACTLMARALRRAPAPRAPRPRPSYRLLPVADSEDKPFTKDLSESETDSDVLFESKSKTTSFGSRLLNGDAPQSHSSWKKNGHYKSSRKVKT